MKRICEDCGELTELNEYNLRCLECNQEHYEWAQDYENAISELLGSMDPCDSDQFDGEPAFFDEHW